MTKGRKGGLSARGRKLLAIFLVVCLAAILSGCQTIGYYRQAIRGEYQILRNRQPIQRLVADPQTSPALKEKFKLVLRLREFAQKELRLPIDGQYLRYVDLHRPYAVWNVHAAQEFSLEPKTWWYPFVGSLKYRGYFSEPDARGYAGKLENKGWQVYVEGVEAYSTLGWFKDPLLNTFISEPEPDLAEILFHELAHQRLFISGDTDFNEAFATTVGEEGARRWLAANKENELERAYTAALARNEQFVGLIMATRDKLKVLYGEKLSANAADAKPHRQRIAEADAIRIREQRESIIGQMRESYAKLKTEWAGLSGYDRWFSRPLNNAQLNTVSAYFDLVPGFRALLRKSGGDLEKFYGAVKNLGKLQKAERHRKVKEAEQVKSLKEGEQTLAGAREGAQS